MHSMEDWEGRVETPKVYMPSHPIEDPFIVFDPQSAFVNSEPFHGHQPEVYLCQQWPFQGHRPPASQTFIQPLSKGFLLMDCTWIAHFSALESVCVLRTRG